MAITARMIDRIWLAPPLSRLVLKLALTPSRAGPLGELDPPRLNAHGGALALRPADLDDHALMLAARPELVQMDKACEGFLGDASIRWRSKVPPPMDTMSPTGILGDARGSTRELGEKMFQERIEHLARMVESGALAR